MTPQAMAATHAAAFFQSRPWSAPEFSALLDSPLVFGLGDPRCFALVRVVADEAELLTIATHPNHQRQGLAHSLMREWQGLAASLGATSAFLEVAEDNAPALALYLREGFTEVGRRKGYYPREGAPAVGAILLNRALP